MNEAPAAHQLHVNAAVVPGPDGRPERVALQLGMGTMGMVIQMDWQAAPGLGDLIRKVLVDAHEQANRASAGLVIPTVGEVQQVNGRTLGK